MSTISDRIKKHFEGDIHIFRAGNILRVNAGGIDDSVSDDVDRT